MTALRRGVATLATREIADALTATAVGRLGSDAVLALADAYRANARARPGRYAATVRAPNSETRRTSSPPEPC